MLNLTFRVNDFQNLWLRIYTVGYPVEGETILTLICDGDKILYTSLTDCYTTSYNHIETLLKTNGNPHIDAFIWTHPDKDHSVGIQTLLEMYDPAHKALIYLPEGFYTNSSFPVCEEAQSAVLYLKEKYNTGQKYQIIPVSLSENESRSLIKISFYENISDRTIHCKYFFMAPFGGLVWRRVSTDAHTPNDLSIVYSMYFNGVNFLFCGDLAEQTIQFLDDQYLQNIYFVKIPHHGSGEPKSFVGKLVEMNVKNAVATTTSFHTTNPKKEILDNYKTISSEINCTGSSHVSSEEYGCIETSFNIKNLTNNTTLSGNAYQYYKSPQ